MSNIHCLTPSRSSPTVSFIPFVGVGYRLQGGYEVGPEPQPGTPVTDATLQKVPPANLEILIAQLQRATERLETTTLAVQNMMKSQETQQHQMRSCEPSLSPVVVPVLPPHSEETAPEGIKQVVSTYSCPEEVKLEDELEEESSPGADYENAYTRGFRILGEEAQDPPTPAEETKLTPRIPEEYPASDGSTPPASQSPKGVIHVNNQIGELRQIVQKERYYREAEKIEDRIRAEENQKSWALEQAMKALALVTTRVTLKDLRQKDSAGWHHLRRYFGEVEQFPQTLRVALAVFTIDPYLQEDLQLNEETMNSTSWEDIKKRLLRRVPKSERVIAETQLLQLHMAATEDVIAFSTKVRREYNATCQLYEVERLGISLNEVLEQTITANMERPYRIVFGSALRREPEAAIKNIDRALRHWNSKDSIFGLGESYPAELEVSSDPEEHNHTADPAVCPSGPAHRKRRPWSCISKRRRNPSLTPTTCTYWLTQCCNFGTRCWNIHQT